MSDHERIDDIENRLSGVSSVLREFRSRLVALENLEEFKGLLKLPPASESFKGQYENRIQPEPTDEEWRVVYREAHPSPHLHMDPCFYENAVAVTLAKQVVIERKRADEYRDTCSARVEDLVEANKERETSEGWAKSGAILVTLWEERFQEATDRIALLEKLLREACEQRMPFRYWSDIIREAFGEDA